MDDALPLELFGLVVEQRSAAYLRCDGSGRVLARGGRLDLYGLGGLGAGVFATAHAVCLEGLFPFRGEDVLLPRVQTESGRFADVHVGRSESGVLVLFLDADADVASRATAQQRGNDLSLLLQRLESRGEEWHGLGDVLSAMDASVLEHVARGRFRSLGPVPDWLALACGGEAEAQAPGEHLPFLENFLIDAEALWNGSRPGHARSGVWAETDEAGKEIFLEAIAIQSRAACSYLVLQRLDEAIEERRQLLQKARETVLRYSNLRREVDKKEVLLHCIVHDLKGPLSGMMGSLSLLRGGKLDPERNATVLQIGLDHANKQLGMIRDVLGVFSSELRELESFHTTPARAPNLTEVVRETVAGARAVGDAQGTELRLDASSPAAALPVVGERGRLERVIANLLENALRHSGSGTTVSVGFRDEGEAAMTWIDDEGPGVPAELAATLFEIGRSTSGTAGIGLYFCRKTIETWGGSIGHTPRPEGGARFWFRLPKARTDWFV